MAFNDRMLPCIKETQKCIFLLKKSEMVAKDFSEKVNSEEILLRVFEKH